MTSQALRRRIFRSLLDQRGSTLVMGLMLVFIMTLLGVALFDVARLDARLKLDSQTGVRALEVAEAGLERGLHLFYLEFTCGPTVTDSITAANCANPPTNPNYITDNTLARIALTTNCPAALLTDGATGFKVLKQDQAFAGGTYTVCVRPDPNGNQHKAQFRSRGVLTSLTGTVARIVQIDATANVTANKPHAPFAIGGPAGGAIKGNALFAGSLQIVKCPPPNPCVALSFGGSGGMQNNYTGLDASLLNRIPSKFQDGTTVNTLGAVLKVKEGQVLLSSNSACIGAQESGSGCPSGGTPFQDTMSGVYTSGTWGGDKFDSCGPPGGLNGQTTTNKKCNVWTSAQGSYPAGDPTSIPLLSDSTIIDGVGYRCFFRPPDPDGIIRCPNSTDPIPGGTNFPEYFYTSAWRIDGRRTNADCDIDKLGATDGSGTTAECTTVLAGLRAGTAPAWAGLTVVGLVSIPVKSTACLKQGGTVRQPSISGTAQAGSSSTITLAATASATDQAYTGMVIQLAGGSGSGQIRQITAYNGSTKVAMVSIPWSNVPDTTTSYRIDVTVGGVQAATATTSTITFDPAASGTNQIYSGMVIQLIAGPGSGQIAEITDYNGSTKVATVSGKWVTSANPVPGFGPAQSGSTTTTINLNLGESGSYTGRIIRLVGGLGAGQSAEIIAYDSSTKVATVGTPWSTVPDTTTYQFETPYRIQMVSCKLQMAGGQIAGWINRETDTSRPADFRPIRPDLEPINVYVNRLAGAPADTPTLRTSDSGDGNMYYQGKIMILADNPAGTPGFEIDTGLLSATTINQPWCSLGSYLCGYAYPANHFVAMLTTSDVLLGTGGTRHVLGQFFAENNFKVAGGLGQTQVAGTVAAQRFDFTGAGGVPSLYQAPWNLGALPGAAGPAAGSFVSIVSSSWVQVQE